MWYINGNPFFFRLPYPYLSLPRHPQSSTVECSPPFQGSKLERWCYPKRLYRGLRTMDGNRPQQQVPHRSATNYLLGPFQFPTTGNPYIHPFGNGGDGQSVGHSIPQPPTYMPPGSTSTCLYAPQTLSYHHNPPVELQNEWGGLRNRGGLFHRIDLRPRGVTGHNQGFPDVSMPLEAVRDHPVRKPMTCLPTTLIDSFSVMPLNIGVTSTNNRS